MATLQELLDFQNQIGKENLDWIYAQPRTRGGWWPWASQKGLSQQQYDTANEWFTKKADVNAWNNSTPEQKQLYTEANKLSQIGRAHV